MNLDKITALLHSRKLRIDPRLSGECKRWFENPGVRRWYYSPDGMTIDEAGEAIAELAGRYGSDRMSEREVCDLLERLFVDGNITKRCNLDSSRSVEAAEVHAIEVRRKTRLRLYECAECNDKLRKASDHWRGEHIHVDPDTMQEFRAPYVLITPVLNAATPF